MPHGMKYNTPLAYSLYKNISKILKKKELLVLVLGPSILPLFVWNSIQLVWWFLCHLRDLHIIQYITMEHVHVLHVCILCWHTKVIIHKSIACRNLLVVALGCIHLNYMLNIQLNYLMLLFAYKTCLELINDLILPLVCVMCVGVVDVVTSDE